MLPKTHRKYSNHNPDINAALNRVADGIAQYPETQEELEARNADVRFLHENGFRFVSKLNYNADGSIRGRINHFIDDGLLSDEWQADYK